MDLILSSLLYAALGIIFEHDFIWWDVIVVIIFAYGPDTDFLPYFVFKKKFGLYSHWIWHYPILFIGVGVPVVSLVCLYLGVSAVDRLFYIFFFVLMGLGHFVIDSRGPQGIQWLYPFSKKAYSFTIRGFVYVTLEERNAFYEKLKQGASERSMFEELKMRLGKWRPEWMSRK